VPAHLYGYGIAESQHPLIREAERDLQHAFPVTRHTPAVIHRRVLLGDTTTEIGRALEDIGADLLVVGVPKRGVISRALFGSTAARLLRVVRVPVLAVPDDGPAGARRESASVQLAA
jgi:nucleotide-binding universal stress UspA family protein